MCDLAYAVLIERFEGDGRALVAAGGERLPDEFRDPNAFRDMVDQMLTADAPTPTGRPVPVEEQELREALGVA